MSRMLEALAAELRRRRSLEINDGWTTYRNTAARLYGDSDPHSVQAVRQLMYRFTALYPGAVEFQRGSRGHPITVRWSSAEGIPSGPDQRAHPGPGEGLARRGGRGAEAGRDRVPQSPAR